MVKVENRVLLQMMTGCAGCRLLIERQTSTPLRMGKFKSSKTRSNGPRVAKTDTLRSVGGFNHLVAFGSQELGDQAAEDMLVLDQ